MSKPGKPAIRIVESGNSESDNPTPPSLVGIRQLPDGSLEYRTKGKDDTARWLPLSSPIRVLALTRDGDNRNWGRLIEVLDADGQVHRWSMPAALLASVRGDDYRQTLLSLGARLAHGSAAANALHRYLSATVDFEGRDLPRARAATRLGWHGDCFVLPDRALGGADLVVYQINLGNPGGRPQEGLARGMAGARCEASGRQHARRARHISCFRCAPLGPAPARRGRHPLQRRIVDRQDHGADRCGQRVGRSTRAWAGSTATNRAGRLRPTPSKA